MYLNAAVLFLCCRRPPHAAALILTPTRELAMQIGKDCKKFTKALNLGVVVVYGGTGISEQIAELKRGAEIIVCTPGRMIDMLAANSGQSVSQSVTARPPPAAADGAFMLLLCDVHVHVSPMFLTRSAAVHVRVPLYCCCLT